MGNMPWLKLTERKLNMESSSWNIKLHSHKRTGTLQSSFYKYTIEAPRKCLVEYIPLEYKSELSQTYTRMRLSEEGTSSPTKM